MAHVISKKNKTENNLFFVIFAQRRGGVTTRNIQMMKGAQSHAV